MDVIQPKSRRDRSAAAFLRNMDPQRHLLQGILLLLKEKPKLSLSLAFVTGSRAELDATLKTALRVYKTDDKVNLYKTYDKLNLTYMYILYVLDCKELRMNFLHPMMQNNMLHKPQFIFRFMINVLV